MPPPPAAFQPVARVNAFVNRHFVAILVSVAAASLVWPDSARALGTWKLLRIGGWALDFPRLALAFMILSASTQCRWKDFREIPRRPKAAFSGMIAYYAVVPVLAYLIGFAVTPFVGPGQALQIRVGLMLTALMPLARTGTFWVQATDGQMPLMLALLTLTTLSSVIIVPLLLGVMAVGQPLKIPFAGIVGEFLVSVIAPMWAGITLRARAPQLTQRWGPVFSFIGLIGLWGAVAANVSVAAPLLHGRVILVLLVFSLAVNVASYAVGLAAAWRSGVPREDAVTLVFGAMRSNGASLVVGLKSFPGMPLVTVPSAVYIVSQHAIASWLSRQILARGWFSPATGRGEDALKARLDAAAAGATVALFRFDAPNGAAPASLGKTLPRLKSLLRPRDFLCELSAELAVVFPAGGEAEADRVASKVCAAARDVAPTEIVSWGVAPVAPGAAAAALKSCRDQLAEQAGVWSQVARR